MFNYIHTFYDGVWVCISKPFFRSLWPIIQKSVMRKIGENLLRGAVLGWAHLARSNLCNCLVRPTLRSVVGYNSLLGESLLLLVAIVYASRDWKTHYAPKWNLKLWQTDQQTDRQMGYLGKFQFQQGAIRVYLRCWSISITTSSELPPPRPQP